MTEEEWLTTLHLDTMLTFLCNQPAIRRRKVGRRKLRLWGCACCRYRWDRITDDRVRAGLVAAERLADGLASSEEATQAFLEVSTAIRECYIRRTEEGIQACDDGPSFNLAVLLLLDSNWQNFSRAGIEAAEMDSGLVEEKPHADLLRDIFGNPFHPVSIDSAWLNWNRGAVVNLAQSIYDERAFEQMPILGDALEEVGCTDADILSHCRGPGPHVRGCWVVDLLLGKS
jgi:hypothetical protein